MMIVPAAGRECQAVAETAITAFSFVLSCCAHRKKVHFSKERICYAGGPFSRGPFRLSWAGRWWPPIRPQPRPARSSPAARSARPRARQARPPARARARPRREFRRRSLPGARPRPETSRSSSRASTGPVTRPPVPPRSLASRPAGPSRPPRAPAANSTPRSGPAWTATTTAQWSRPAPRSTAPVAARRTHRGTSSTRTGRR